MRLGFEKKNTRRLRKYFLFIFLILLSPFLNFKTFLGAIYQRESFQGKNVFFKKASKGFISKRNYPGGVDEEDLVVTELREPKAKITRSSLERKALKNLKQDE